MRDKNLMIAIIGCFAITVLFLVVIIVLYNLRILELLTPNVVSKKA